MIFRSFILKLGDNKLFLQDIDDYELQCKIESFKIDMGIQ